MRLLLLCAVVLGLTCAAATAHADEIYYQAGFTDDLYKMDLNTGVETKIGDMGVADSWGFSFSQNGTLYGFNRGTSSLYTINTSTAALTLIGSNNLASVENLTFDSTGANLYVTSGSSLYTLDVNNGAATFVGGLGTSLDGLTVDPNTGKIYGVDSGSLYEVDVNTPGTTLLGSVSADETLAFGSAMYGHRSGAFYSIDLNTLNSTLLWSTAENNVFASAVDNSVVPEPGSLALLALGFGAIVVGRRRRARA